LIKEVLDVLTRPLGTVGRLTRRFRRAVPLDSIEPEPTPVPPPDAEERP
jgi:hypothetical protein